GTGLALLQTASNPYVTILGPMESAARRISLMGICNKIAGILSVYILGSITLKNADQIKARIQTLSPIEKSKELDLLASKVIGPYWVIAGVLALLAVIFYFIHLPEIREEEEAIPLSGEKVKTSLLQYPHLI